MTSTSQANPSSLEWSRIVRQRTVGAAFAPHCVSMTPPHSELRITRLNARPANSLRRVSRCASAAPSVAREPTARHEPVSAAHTMRSSSSRGVAKSTSQNAANVGARLEQSPPDRSPLASVRSSENVDMAAVPALQPTLHHVDRPVSASIVDEQQLTPLALAGNELDQRADRLRDSLLLVVHRHDQAQGRSTVHSFSTTHLHPRSCSSRQDHAEESEGLLRLRPNRAAPAPPTQFPSFPVAGQHPKSERNSPNTCSTRPQGAFAARVYPTVHIAFIRRLSLAMREPLRDPS